MSFEKRHLYDCLPGIVQEAIGWGLRFNSRFKWQPTPEERLYFEALSRTEFASAEELQEIQLSKLRRLLQHASAHVPYYRNLFHKEGIDSHAIRSIDDLSHLPLLTKDMIRENPTAFLSEHVAGKANLTKITTGGSTGTPMCYYFDAHMVGVRRATWWRWSKFAGVDLYKDRLVYCGGAPSRWIYPPESYRGIVNYERTMLTLSSAAMSDRVLDTYIDDIRIFRGDYIRGYASGLYMIARRLLERGTTLPLKAALTSSDTLYPQYRECIEKAFQCQVYDHYGQNEDILTATECGIEPGLHINSENCIAETVDADGNSVHGAEGRFVSTHLENYVTPLIRYVVGDVGVLDHQCRKCACGRSHQKILNFTGRDDEIIQTPEGRRIGCGSMNQPMKTMHDAIARCQFTQESLSLLTVRIVPASKWNDAEHFGELEANIRKQVGDEIRIQIEKVDTIPTRPNGKFQFIVSNIGKASNSGRTP